MAKGASNEREDDALDVVDLLADETAPASRRTEPEPEEREPKARRRRMILLAVAAIVVAIVGISVSVTRDDGDREEVGIREDVGASDARGEAREQPDPTAPDIEPEVWRQLGARFGLGFDTHALIVDGTSGMVEVPRTLPNGAVRIVGGHSGALGLVAGDVRLLLDGSRITESEDVIFPGVDPGLWWTAHARDVTALTGTADPAVTPGPTRAIAAVRDGFVVVDQSSVLLSAGGALRPLTTTPQPFVVAVHPDRVAWRNTCPGDACGVHVTEVATGRDVLLPPGVVSLFTPGRAYGRFSPDGRYLALHVADGLGATSDLASGFVLVDLSAGAIISRFDIGVRITVPGASGDLRPVPFDFTPDGQRIVVADWTQGRGRLVIVNTADGSIERSLEQVGRISSLAALDTQPTPATTPLAEPASLGTGATVAVVWGNGVDVTTVDLDTGRQHVHAVPSIANAPEAGGEFESRLAALDGGFAWVRAGEAFFAAAGTTNPVSLGPAAYVMAGSTPQVGWTVRRTDDGWDLTRFDGSSGALGATYHSAAAPAGAVRRGLVVGRPASFTRGSDIEIWDPETNRSFAIEIQARAPTVGAAGGTRVVWFDQTCSGACRTQVTDTETGETRPLPENAYPFSWSATTPTGDLLYVQVQNERGETHLAAVDLATMELVDVPDSDDAETWASSAEGVVVFARQGDVFVWKPGWPASRFLAPGGFGPAAGIAVR